jgi:hypothetical protein
MNLICFPGNTANITDNITRKTLKNPGREPAVFSIHTNFRRRQDKFSCFTGSCGSDQDKAFNGEVL